MFFENFEEFLKQLVLPSGELFGKLDGFVFRGLSSGKHELIPTALREGSRERLWSLVTADEATKELEYWQIQAEYSLIREFYRIANQKGLKVPRIKSISNNYATLVPFELFIQENNYLWIDEEFEELVAFAQHYGLPTRMLDWTFDVNVAMYFASSGAAKRYYEEGEKREKDVMVIWALNAQFYQMCHPRPIVQAPLAFVVPSYSDNPNVRAQKGILSHWRIEVPGTRSGSTGMQLKKIDRTPLDQLLAKDCASPFYNQMVMLYKFIIPQEEMVNMYHYVHKMGYGAASLFPGYAGVVKEITENKIIKSIQE